MTTDIRRECFRLFLLIGLQVFSINYLLACSCGFSPRSFCESITPEYKIVLATYTPPYFPGVGKMVDWRDTTKGINNFPFLLNQFYLETDESGHYNFKNILLYQDITGVISVFFL